MDKQIEIDMVNAQISMIRRKLALRQSQAEYLDMRLNHKLSRLKELTR